MHDLLTNVSGGGDISLKTESKECVMQTSYRNDKVRDDYFEKRFLPIIQDRDRVCSAWKVKVHSLHKGGKSVSEVSNGSYTEYAILINDAYRPISLFVI